MLNAKLLKLPVNSHQHHHEHHQIVVGVRGAAELSVDGVSSFLDTWKACLVPTEARHDYCGDQQNHVLVINLDPLSPALDSPAHADYERMARIFEKPRTVQMDNRLQGLVQFAAGEFDRSPDNEPLHRHLAASILYSMADRIVDGQAIRASRHSISPDAIRRYIVDNLHRKITVQDLAREACLSASRFHEVFREVSGITPSSVPDADPARPGRAPVVDNLSFRVGNQLPDRLFLPECPDQRPAKAQGDYPVSVTDW